MRYVFAKDKLKVSIQLEPGGVTLYFPPDEQWLAEAILTLIRDTLETDELDHVISLVRTRHEKCEEN